MSADRISFLERVVVVPRSGYINRLQAMASAALIATDHGAHFQVCWDPQSAAPASAAAILNPDFIAQHVIDPSIFLNQFGYSCSDVPRHFTVERDVISIAGFERGEQAFMSNLEEVLSDATSPMTLVISAGGNYFLGDKNTAITRRGDWYRNFHFAQAIEHEANKLTETSVPYLGLHLRYTDRAHETPLAREIHATVMKQVEQTGINSVFIASDTSVKLDKWMKKLAASGLKPWTAPLISHDRASELAGVGAMVDWKVLGAAISSVYFEASSFGHEAAVMAGTIDTSTALRSHPVRKWQSRGKTLATASLRYPKSHWLR